MFMVFSKEKILSYLVSLGTVALLFVMSFAITTRNNELMETSANTTTINQINNDITNNVVINSINNGEKDKQKTNNISLNNQTCNDIKETNCVNNNI